MLLDSVKWSSWTALLMTFTFGTTNKHCRKEADISEDLPHSSLWNLLLCREAWDHAYHLPLASIWKQMPVCLIPSARGGIPPKLVGLYLDETGVRRVEECSPLIVELFCSVEEGDRLPFLSQSSGNLLSFSWPFHSLLTVTILPPLKRHWKWNTIFPCFFQ